MCSSCIGHPRRGENSLRQNGEDVTHGLDGHNGALVPLHGPDPAPVVEVAGKGGQRGRGGAAGSHVERGPGVRHVSGVLHVEHERHLEVQR